MKPSEVFPRTDKDDLEESIRVDRDIGDEGRLNLLRDYHVTKESRTFLADFFRRTLGDTEQKRRGWNHWLYGYYGSGKSHLLAVLGNLTDSAWIGEIGRDEVWEALANEEELVQLRDLWEENLDAYHLKPLFVNLLKYQGREQKGFNDILLSESHTEEGLSSRLDVAYFERWYQSQGQWQDRDDNAQRVLKTAGVNGLPKEPWESVQKYRVLSDLVLPELFEEVTGMRDGLSDLRPSHLNPSEVLSELEEWRTKLQDEASRPVKLVLLLDEVSLFIGTDYEQLTQLQLVAERIDDIGQGNILSVVTAQERIEHVQPEYAGKSPDFGILKDRFPHRHQLPSRHVGEIVENRLLNKPNDIRERLEEGIIEETAIRPEDTFIYSNVQQNTDPPLDDLDQDRFLDFYPLLPFQPPLFLEILSNLRGRDVDRAKSVFSGTARAVLALVDALLEDWREDRKATELVNLVDFYEVIRPELVEIIPQKVQAVDEIAAEAARGDLEAFDVDVAKAVLLLQYASDLIPIDQHENIAVSVMRDLEGPTRIAMSNQVDDALDRLDKYLGPGLQFRDAEQREIYADAQRYEERGNWDELFEPVNENLWADIVRQLDLPESIPFGDDSDTYPVAFEFEVDGRGVEETFGAEDGLHVPISVEGVLPAETDSPHHDKLVWIAKEEGRSPVRDAIQRWAALAKAMQERPPQEAIQQDLVDRHNEATKLVTDLLTNGSYRVRERTTQNRAEALKWIIDQRYPAHFHPIMLDIEGRHLRELAAFDPGDDRPEWAVKLEVPTEDPSTHHGDIQTKVRGLIGRAIKDSGQDQLSLQRLLEVVASQESFYVGISPALVSILWGLCRKGDFLPVNQQGEPLAAEALLDENRWNEIQIRIADLPGQFREAVEKVPGIESTDSNDEALVKLQGFLRRIEQQLRSLNDDVDVTEDAIRSTQTKTLLNALTSTIDAKQTGAETRIDRIGRPGVEWDTLVEEALEDHAWVEDVRARWTRRQMFLLQLDALLALPTEGFPWLDDRSRERLSSLQEEVDGLSGVEWWTSAGWQDFVTAIPARDHAVEALHEAWATYCEEDGREHLAVQIESHSWTVDPIQLPPTTVHQAFQNQILHPLRAFQHAFDEQSSRASRLLQQPAKSDKQDLLWLLESLDDEPTPLRDAPPIDEARNLMERLDNIVEDRRFDEILGIGLLPDDEELLRSNIDDLEDPAERAIRPVDGGAIIE